ncbi:MAG: elongation factor P maturation arginine rhamnosyltransferase EarP [Sphingomonadaceae bacterium]
MSDTSSLRARRAFQQNRAEQAAFLASLGVDVSGMAYARKLSLHADPALAQPPLAELFALLQPAATPTLFLLPASLAAVAAGATRGGLTVHLLPELDTAGAQRLLWCCDFNFFSGDLAHAEAAARPFLWQAGTPAQAAAYVERYSAGLPPHAAHTLRTASATWNGVGEDHAAITACLAGPVNRTLSLHAAEWAAA